MSEQAMTYRVETFTEVIQYPEDEAVARAQRNIVTRIEAAGLDPGDLIWCTNYHPQVGVYVVVATLIPTGNELRLVK